MITERTEVSAQAVCATDAPSRAGAPPWLIWGGMIGLVQIFAIATVQPLGVSTAYPQLVGYLVDNTNRRTRVHKKQQLPTPSLRFPLLAGGTEPLRGSPREAGGT